MPGRPTAGALFAILALACAATRGGDAPAARPPAPDPDAGFLEFLGSVDRLTEVNPDYLATPQGAKGPIAPAPPATPVSTPAVVPSQPAPGPA